MTTYEIVTADERGNFTTARFPNYPTFAAAMHTAGATFGRYTTREHDRRLRRELIGHPVFQNFHGPMWGGTDESGSPVVRYENPRAAEILSA